jgi:hypothetical protein
MHEQARDVLLQRDEEIWYRVPRETSRREGKQKRETDKPN